jgi:succinate dehydrogenase / fumarate reductase iron-sulfur subunit
VRLRIAKGTGGEFVEHEIEVGPTATVLDALEEIRGSRDKDLLYRHSCHHGSCGTCGALVNGAPRLMCIVRLAELGDGPILLEPLRRMARIGDLAVSPAPLFSAMPDAGYLCASEVAHRAPAEHPLLRLENCIECAICVSACPVERPFSGPAALAAADRDREERPDREEAALAFAARPEGVAACERRFECSRVCPQSVYPGRHIENLRKSLAARGASMGATKS